VDVASGFEDQVVVVTGAGRGLGEAYARLFADLRATVVVHDAGVDADGVGADPSVAERVVADITTRGGHAEAATANLLEPGACESLIDDAVTRHGRVDALVHNAGVVRWEDPDRPSDEIWRQTMGVNVEAGFRLVQRVVPHMRARGYGRIVLTTSGRATSVDNAAPGLVAYSAAELAVVGLMVGVAADLTGHDVHVNAISPIAATRVLVRDAPELTTASVAPGAVFLASPGMRSSGHVLAAAGGRFRLDRWHEGRPVDLGPTPTVGELASAWSSLATEP
jgi:NAD(P)-dependent dehydrogenase (short-subunit alcohol dehydrogenase family)